MKAMGGLEREEAKKVAEKIYKIGIRPTLSVLECMAMHPVVGDGEYGLEVYAVSKGNKVYLAKFRKETLVDVAILNW